MSSILIVGSSNTDMVIQTPHLPSPGETILGGTFFMNAGGKGANQAVAASRLGGSVSFITKTGDDLFGQRAREGFLEEGIDISLSVIDTNNPSGVALITVDSSGENTIVVASGSNATLLPHDLQLKHFHFDVCRVVLMQLEIPMPTVQYIAATAHEHGVPVILNPAPGQSLHPDLLQLIDIITPNETEASMITGITVTDIRSAERAAGWLIDRGVPTVIITLGAKGALLCMKGVVEHIAAPMVTAVDTTAAGDVFNGALAVGISKSWSMIDSVRFACKAASLSVTKMGAQQSAPYFDQVEKF